MLAGLLLFILIVLPIILVVSMPSILNVAEKRLWMVARWLYDNWIQKSRFNVKRILFVFQIVMYVLLIGQILYLLYEVYSNQDYPLSIIASLAFSIVVIFILRDLTTLSQGHGNVIGAREKQQIIIINVQSFAIHAWFFCMFLGMLPVLPDNPLFFYVALLLLPILLSSFVHLTDFLKKPTKYRRTGAYFIIIVVASISFYQEFLSLMTEAEANIAIAFLVPFFITIYSALDGFLFNFLPLVQHWPIFQKIKKEIRTGRPTSLS
ncbi:hypothetical protein EPH95_05875 [Salicibibacter halophilus]|uniref:Uncharacterized protein n=1 Tax=Salicibibacter halophilus TaxID=2502791 RepID=A0A514LGU9_9BACI|nr:hypothetical protein [Salicibibacter halophilus]QDI90765.1 hypothetical protein EPH95_05875 [Salicibibacter halophilus]